jgi:hypothetical protein
MRQRFWSANYLHLLCATHGNLPESSPRSKEFRASSTTNRAHFIRQLSGINPHNRDTTLWAIFLKIYESRYRARFDQGATWCIQILQRERPRADGFLKHMYCQHICICIYIYIYSPASQKQELCSHHHHLSLRLRSGDASAASAFSISAPSMLTCFDTLQAASGAAGCMPDGAFWPSMRGSIFAPAAPPPPAAAAAFSAPAGPAVLGA